LVFDKNLFWGRELGKVHVQMQLLALNLNIETAKIYDVSWRNGRAFSKSEHFPDFRVPSSIFRLSQRGEGSGRRGGDIRDRHSILYRMVYKRMKTKFHSKSAFFPPYKNDFSGEFRVAWERSPRERGILTPLDPPS
jgi:hypothetical protein